MKNKQKVRFSDLDGWLKAIAILGFIYLGIFVIGFIGGFIDIIFEII